jgi:chromosomal replication initiator protein
MSADLWLRGCERLAAELPEQQFNTWIRPLPVADVSHQGDLGAVVTLRVPNRFKLDWIRNQYAGRIEAVLTDLAGKPVRLDITLAARDGALVPAVNGAAPSALLPAHRERPWRHSRCPRAAG